MSKKTFYWLKLITLAFFIFFGTFVSYASAYYTSETVKTITSLDRVIALNWQKYHLPIPRQASPEVLLRRLYLDLTGTLPTPSEITAFKTSETVKQYPKLVDKLLKSPKFTNYWTLHFGDILRLKSEFPVNLWPNAVYGYQRYIQNFLNSKQSYEDFARALLTASGSNFRQSEVNFLRSASDRTPEGVAQMIVLTFWNTSFDKLNHSEQDKLISLLSQLHFKNTKEWKEEMVYWSTPQAPEELADFICQDPRFASALVNRVWYWFFGRELSNSEADQTILEELSTQFRDSKYNLESLCRQIVNCNAYLASSVPLKNSYNITTLNRYFALYPVRRLEAEVLEDLLSTLTQERSALNSVIPEPFTYLPKEQCRIELADGSIGNSFLQLFGRPSRDSGALAERNNRITAQQRLWLFNSGDLNRRLGRIFKRDDMRKRSTEERIKLLYLLTYCRQPTTGELNFWLEHFKDADNYKRQMSVFEDLSWVLVNSKEFLYQH